MALSLILYGLDKCSTCQKAAQALREAGHEVKIHDVRAQPLEATQLEEWWSIFGERLCNSASLTWRRLPDSERDLPMVARLLAYPSLMKRPLIVFTVAQDKQYFLGWTKAVQQALGIV